MLIILNIERVRYLLPRSVFDSLGFSIDANGGWRLASVGKGDWWLVCVLFIGSI